MDVLSRREFVSWALKNTGALSLLVSGGVLPRGTNKLALAAEPKAQKPLGKEVMFYKKLDSRAIECGICFRRCRVAEGDRGFCGNKENRNGRYYLLVYGQACAVHKDPIEKKPLFHYLPGTTAFSIAASGCNLQCKFCQNWEISQFRPEEVEHSPLSPEDAGTIAKKNDCPTIAYTYSEPTVFYTYMYDVARTARQAGIGSVMISNGCLNEEPLRALCKELSAVKIDLKAFSDEFYQKYCSGELKPVLQTLIRLKEIGIWFEIVNLLIPTLNDNREQLKQMCIWIRDNLGTDVPVHFTRFHPMYQIRNLPPTPVGTLEMARETALSAGLHFPYVGNVPGHGGESTYCPGCKKTLIRRLAFTITENAVIEGKCRYCQRPIPGIWTRDQVHR